ncbi:MAG: arylsulfatase A-like enzyme [Planctomycetota bacterium]|jgi:arylsulfatase A-like enzyme
MLLMMTTLTLRHGLLQGRLLRGALIVGPLVLISACGGGDESNAGFRHILLISLDTTRADHIGAYVEGRAATPQLDALAGQGVRFADVTAPAPTTLASHTSMMTGTYPHTHGVPRNNHEVHEDNDMLAETLHAAGFHTAGILGSFALERRFRFNQGFEHFDEEFNVEVDMGGVDQNQRDAARVTDAVLYHIDEFGPDEQPMFLFAHYFDPHLPYDPPADIAQRYTGGRTLPESTTIVCEHMVVEHQQKTLGYGIGYRPTLMRGFPRELLDRADGQPLPTEDVIAGLYAGEVTYMDGQIGRLIDGLEGRGLLDETLIIITGDHGETFWEHPDYWNHGSWVFQTTIRVPLIMRFPDGRGAGRVVANPVSTIDVVPTICELLELELPERVEGTSLVPAIDGAPFERGYVFSEGTQPYDAEKGAQWKNERKPQCVREGSFKFVNAPYVAGGGYQQLFDLAVDPGEQNNLLRGGVSTEHLAIRDRLSERLREFTAAASPLPVQLNKTLQDETRERLESLGYLEPSNADEDEEELPKEKR